MDDYKDMLDLPHHVSKKHKPMPMISRAAQFAPFAALTGYGDAVKETARLTDDRIDLSDEEIEKLNNKLGQMQSMLEEKVYPEVAITYFRPDEKKEGGAYITAQGTVKKIREHEEILVLESRHEIAIPMITEVEILPKDER